MKAAMAAMAFAFASLAAPRGPLFRLEASQRSLAMGTRPVESSGTEPTGPGAMLGLIEEIRNLFP